MSFQIQDRVQETTTTTGTGALSLGGAVAGFRAFSSVCANGDTFYYALQSVSSTGVPVGAWEVGIGTYNTSGNTLSRTTVLASSNSNAVVSLTAGTTQVWLDLPAAFQQNLPISAKYFGAQGNTRIVNDGVTTSSSPTLTSATAAFTAADVGKTVDVVTTTSTGVATLIVHGTITAYTNATTVTLSANASASATGANVVCGTDDGAALTAFINYLLNNWPCRGELPAGVYYSSVTLPTLNRPIALFGQSRRTSIIQFGANVSGQCLTLQNVGFNSETTDLPQPGNTAWQYNADVSAGLTLRDFTLQGNRGCTALQHGMTMQGNCDWLDISHVDSVYFRGAGVQWMYTGTGSAQIREAMREGNINNMKVRHCGDYTTNTFSFGVYLDDSPAAPTYDSSNLFNFNNIDIVFSYGGGLAVQDRRTSNTGNPLYGLRFKNILLHDRYTNIGGSAGRLLSVVGQVEDCTFDINFGFSIRNDYAVEILPNATINTYSYDNEYYFNMSNTVKGVTYGAGGNANIHFRSYYGCGEAFYCSTESPTGMTITCETDNVFQQIGSSMQLSGTSAIAIPGWVFNTTPNLAAFMPVYNTNGTGDTTKAVIFQVAGTITRAGSTTAGTDTYTFTPAASNGAYIPAGEYFSKICIDGTQGGGVAGRYKFIPEDRYGYAGNSYWGSGRLLSLNPWQFHVENATQFVRMSYGAPTADNVGNALVPMTTLTSNSATPAVAGITKVLLNPSSALTVTNFTGGVDAQPLTVIASTANVTIANNTNIHTSTGANITMTAKQVLRFTYDATLAQWCN